MDDQTFPRVIEAGIGAESGSAQVQMVPKTPAPGQTPVEISFTYARAHGHRSVHADGVVGGATPSGGLSLMFFSERQAVPAEQRFEIKDGHVGKQLTTARIGTEGIERTLETEVMISLEAATQFHAWLGKQISALRVRQQQQQA